MTVPARLSIVTLGVDDLDRSIAFYEALGWARRPSSIEGSIAWFGTADTHVGLFPWERAGLDAALPRGATRAVRRDHPGHQRRVARSRRGGAGRRGSGRRQPAQAGDRGRLGWRVRLLRGPGWPPLGDRLQPGLPDRLRRAGAHPLTDRGAGGDTGSAAGRPAHHQPTRTAWVPVASGASRR